MSRYFSSFFIAFGIYVLFYLGFFYFLKNNKIILDEPTITQKISLNHIEIKPVEKEIVEDKIVNNDIQEEIKEEIEKQKIEKKQEEIIEEKVVEVQKPIIKKEIKKVQKREIVEKKQITKKEIKETKNMQKEVIVKEQMVQKHIQSEEIVKNQINDVPKIDDRKAYLDKHLLQIRNLINKNVHYPTRARKLSIEGIVIAKFKINKDGSIENITILEGHKFLQNATIEAIQEASKSFPKTNESIEIQIPIEYKLI